MLGPTADARETGALSGEALETVYRNELRLLKLVNNLLDFARMEANRAEASYEPPILAAMTRDLASNFRAATEGAGLELRVACAPLVSRLRRPRHVGEDRPQPAVERVQVHVRRIRSR
jgi:signal transduction histidine kinase